MIKKKILLVSFSFDQNLGIRIISSKLSERYEVSKLYLMEYGTFDSYKSLNHNFEFNYDLIVKFCKKFEYVFISSTSYHDVITFKICKKIKKNSNIKIILGGPLTVFRPEESINYSDAICIWEGHNILDLMDYFEGKKLENNTLENFVVKDKKIKTVFSSLKTYDDMPYPDYSKKNSFFYIKNEIIKKEDYDLSIVNIETTKGCVFNCSFCSIPSYNKIRKKNKLPLVVKCSIKGAVNRIRYIIEQNPKLESILIHDDNFFNYDLNEIKEIVRELNKFIQLPITLQIDPRSKEFMKKFIEFSKLKTTISYCIGIQSGSERVNKKIYNRFQSNKNLLENHNRMLKVIEKNNSRIFLKYFIIYANPYETKKDVLNTINLMLKLKNARFLIYSYTPIPNTPLGDKLLNHMEIVGRFGLPDYKTFRKQSFYYAFLFFINFLNTYKLNKVLPKKFKPNIITELLNNNLFAWIFYKYTIFRNQLIQKNYNKNILKQFNFI